MSTMFARGETRVLEVVRGDANGTVEDRGDTRLEASTSCVVS